MGYLRFLAYPLLGAFVGYITNYIAIKLLFWPKRRVLGEEAAEAAGDTARLGELRARIAVLLK